MIFTVKKTVYCQNYNKTGGGCEEQSWGRYCFFHPIFCENGLKWIRQLGSMLLY